MIDQQPSTPSSEHPALVAYRARNRRLMTIWLACLVAAVLAAAGGVILAYAHGDINHVHWKSAAAPNDIPPAPVGRSLQRVWRTDDSPVSGNPVSGGIVVTHDQHTVNGRDALTGDVRWHYTRTDRVLCAVVQQDATTTAIYRHDGNCDEVTGFTTATGERKFWRTLTDNGDVAVSSAPNVIVIVSNTTVHVIDNAGGLDRWDYEAPSGCQIDRALAGSLGVLIGFHCGTTWRLVVHDLIQGDKDKTVAKWDVTLNFPGYPILADTVLAVIDRDNGDLVTVSADKGLVNGDVRFLKPNDPAIVALPRSETTQTIDYATKAELAHVGSTLYAITKPDKAKLPSVQWSTPSDGLSFGLFDARLTVVRNGSVSVLSGAEGKVDYDVAFQPTSQALQGAVSPRAFGLAAGLVLCGNGVEFYQ